MSSNSFCEIGYLKGNNLLQGACDPYFEDISNPAKMTLMTYTLSALQIAQGYKSHFADFWSGNHFYSISNRCTADSFWQAPAMPKRKADLLPDLAVNNLPVILRPSKLFAISILTFR